MTSRAWPDIDRARKGKRGSSRLKGEGRPPHLRVICSSKGDDERLPALAFIGGDDVVNHLWMDHPEKPRKEPVAVYAARDSAGPDYVITPPSSGHATSVVTTQNSEMVVTAEPRRSLFRSSWVIHAPDRPSLFTMTERKRDALWRRTFGPPTKIQDSAWDVFGLIISIIFLPTMFRPPAQMPITDSTGSTIGLATFASVGRRPREDFCLYLDNQPYPIRDNTLALAVIAVMQRMR